MMKTQLTNELLTFESDHIWISKNIEKLLDRYSEQWIAVKDRRVIASDFDIERLISKLRDPAYTCIEFITRESLEMVL